MRIQLNVKRLDYFLFSFFHFFCGPFNQLPSLLISCIPFRALDEQALWERTCCAVLVYLLYWSAIALIVLTQSMVVRAKGILGQSTIELRDDGLFVDSRLHQAISYWPSIERVVTRPGHIAVYVNSAQAYLIPRRTFIDRAQCAQFITTVRAHLRQDSTKP